MPLAPDVRSPSPGLGHPGSDPPVSHYGSTEEMDFSYGSRELPTQ